MNQQRYEVLQSTDAPESLTIERLDSVEELILAQTTSQCCRCCCTQKSINWALAEQNHFPPGTNPFDLPTNGWIHEESNLCGRTCSWISPGCRAVKYVQHAGSVPESLKGENNDWCTIQSQTYPVGLSEIERHSDIIATHEKECTCGYCFKFGDCTFPICNCFPLPYLESKKSDGTVLGRTEYICDGCMFVPKFDVLGADGTKKFHIRPDTCFCGCCMRCRCDNKKKCFRVPFVVRDPRSLEALGSSRSDGTLEERKAKIDSLWSGWKNECCSMKDAYHIVYPEKLSVEDKLLLTGSGLLIDLTIFEQKNDD